ncbi:hypothetical protein [Streptomyces sp. NPDC008265]|uniref:hypothetical protein n=1 Tax=Streptomyces sp. NPDC008265 TaxID=3364824 RepID=UPI0036E07D43
MIWWCKARALTHIAAATLGTILAGLLIGQIELPIPVLTGQSGHFLLAHLMTIIPAVTLLYGLGRGDARSTITAVRPVSSWDTTLGLIAAGSGAVVAVVCHLLTDSELALVLGRNQAGYIGLALLLYPLLGSQLTAATLAALPLMLAGGGWRPNGRPEQWAWLLHDSASTPATLITLALLGLGSIAPLAWIRPPIHIGAAA